MNEYCECEHPLWDEVGDNGVAVCNLCDKMRPPDYFEDLAYDLAEAEATGN